MSKKITIIWLFFVILNFTDLWSRESSGQKELTIPATAALKSGLLPIFIFLELFNHTP